MILVKPIKPMDDDPNVYLKCGLRCKHCGTNCVGSFWVSFGDGGATTFICEACYHG